MLEPFTFGDALIHKGSGRQTPLCVQLFCRIKQHRGIDQLVHNMLDYAVDCLQLIQIRTAL
ncbi:hypothetical protein D3C81_1961620 [compost metagenome]